MDGNVKVEHHLPATFTAAEAASGRGQKRFKLFTAASLVLLTVAAACGIWESPIAGAIAAVAFGASFTMSAWVVTRDMQDAWYDGRALAESAKSLTYKYAVGGAPFEVGNPTATERWATSVADIVGELRRLQTVIEPAAASLYGDTALQALRAAPLARRIGIYREERLEGQRRWYATRSRDHRETAQRWQVAAGVLQLVGVLGAVLKAFDLLHFDLLGLCAAAAAAAVAWLQAGDYVMTARAYEVTTLDISTSLSRLDAVDTEETWATFVADAEQAMSREHTMWTARRRAL
jgi:hypothetical protein